MLRVRMCLPVRARGLSEFPLKYQNGDVAIMHNKYTVLLIHKGNYRYDLCVHVNVPKCTCIYMLTTVNEVPNIYTSTSTVGTVGTMHQITSG